MLRLILKSGQISTRKKLLMNKITDLKFEQLSGLMPNDPLFIVVSCLEYYWEQYFTCLDRAA